LAGADLHELLGRRGHARFRGDLGRRVDVPQHLAREGVAEEVDARFHDALLRIEWFGFTPADRAGDRCVTPAGGQVPQSRPGPAVLFSVPRGRAPGERPAGIRARVGSMAGQSVLMTGCPSEGTAPGHRTADSALGSPRTPHGCTPLRPFTPAAPRLVLPPGASRTVPRTGLLCRRP